MSLVSVDMLLKLLQFPRIGRRTALKILNQNNSVIRDDRDLANLLDASSINIRLPKYKKTDFDFATKKTEEILNKSEKLDIKIVSLFNEQFPKLLKNISDPPLLLNYRGNLSALNESPCVAVVGTREPTSYGYERGKKIGEIISSEKMTVASGLAKGCDTAGHLGALKGYGLTAAVLAHGLDTIYPKENKGLAEDILSSNGLLLSEYFVGQKSLTNYFVERDRIQAGISNCVFIVETDVRGGTMHTVKYCIEYNRILACLEHPQEFQAEPKAQGNRMLIAERKGIAIYSASDVMRLLEKVKSAYGGTNTSTNPDSLNQKDEKTQLGLWD